MQVKIKQLEKTKQWNLQIANIRYDEKTIRWSLNTQNKLMSIFKNLLSIINKIQTNEKT